MKKKLGILVTSKNHLDKIIGICKAAVNKNIEIHMFLTHLGVMITQDNRFHEIASLASISICNVSFEKYELKQPVIGINKKDYATQSRNAIMLEDCQRYIVF